MNSNVHQDTNENHIVSSQNNDHQSETYMEQIRKNQYICQKEISQLKKQSSHVEYS